MEVEVLATLLGVALAALVAACGAGFRWMRSDFRDLRNHVDTRFAEQTARFDRLDNRFNRLEARFDDLIMALARAGALIDPQHAAPTPSPPLPQQSKPVSQQPDPTPTPAGEAAARPWPEGSPSEIADSPRAPPATGGQSSTDPTTRSPPPEPFGPTTAPA